MKSAGPVPIKLSSSKLCQYLGLSGPAAALTALADRGIAACIPSKVNRKVPIPPDTVLYRQRHKIENMFAKLKDWRRIHTGYDRCAHTFVSAICIAAVVIFGYNQ